MFSSNSIMEKYDIIAVMNSGVSYACEIMQNKISRGSDARLLAFFPVNLSTKQYKKALMDENYHSLFSWEIKNAESKFKSFQNNKQQYLLRILEDIKAITSDEVNEFREKTIFPHTYISAHETIARNNWAHYLSYIEKQKQFPNITLDDFIMNPEIRLTEKADPTRTAVICDDYVYEGGTIVHTIHDIFRLGYTNINFLSQASSYSLSSFEGNFEAYKKKYKDKTDEIEFIQRDLIKEAF
jgi:hypothetical protein